MKNLEVLKFVSQQLPWLTQGINNNRKEKEEETNKHYRQMTNKWSRNYENNVIRYLDIAYNLRLLYETALVYYFIIIIILALCGGKGVEEREGAGVKRIQQ